MSKVIQLAGRLRAVAPYIRTEDEAIELAKALAADIRSGSGARNRQRLLPHDEMAMLSQSGLLGITVTTDYGGADISNPFLAEVLAILSEADSSIGQILQNHFYILEVLRLAGTEEQKRYFFTRALAGDHFTNALAERNGNSAEVINMRPVPDGPGFRIFGQKYYSTGALFSDWVAVFALDTQDRIVMAIIPRDIEGLTVTGDWAGPGQRATASGSVTFSNVYVSADSIVDHYKAFEQPTPLGSLGQLLHAAVDLGIARAAFADLIDFVKTRSRGNSNVPFEIVSDDPMAIARAGSIAVKIEAAAAVIERAGRMVDMAQVSPSADAAREASIAVATAKILTTEAALEATNALFELTGTSATDEGLNLDRHWLGTRTHTVHDPVGWKHHAIGDYHLNGRLPMQTGQF